MSGSPKVPDAAHNELQAKLRLSTYMAKSHGPLDDYKLHEAFTQCYEAFHGLTATQRARQAEDVRVAAEETCSDLTRFFEDETAIPPPSSFQLLIAAYRSLHPQVAAKYGSALLVRLVAWAPKLRREVANVCFMSQQSIVRHTGAILFTRGQRCSAELFQLIADSLQPTASVDARRFACLCVDYMCREESHKYGANLATVATCVAEDMTCKMDTSCRDILRQFCRRAVIGCSEQAPALATEEAATHTPPRRSLVSESASTGRNAFFTAAEVVQSVADKTKEYSNLLAEMRKNYEEEKQNCEALEAQLRAANRRIEELEASATAKGTPAMVERLLGKEEKLLNAALVNATSRQEEKQFYEEAVAQQKESITRKSGEVKSS